MCGMAQLIGRTSYYKGLKLNNHVVGIFHMVFRNYILLLQLIQNQIVMMTSYIQ